MLPFTASFRKLFVYHYFIEVNFFSFSSVIYRNINLFYKVIMISSCCLTHKVFHCFPRKILWKMAFTRLAAIMLPEMKILWLLTKFWLSSQSFYLFQSSSYTCTITTVNRFCKRLFTPHIFIWLSNEITASAILPVLHVFYQLNLILLEPNLEHKASIQC